MSMSYTIITDECEGFADCVDACPIACIYEAKGGVALPPALLPSRLWQKR